MNLLYKFKWTAALTVSYQSFKTVRLEFVLYIYTFQLKWKRNDVVKILKLAESP